VKDKQNQRGKKECQLDTMQSQITQTIRDTSDKLFHGEGKKQRKREKEGNKKKGENLREPVMGSRESKEGGKNGGRGVLIINWSPLILWVTKRTGKLPT